MARSVVTDEERERAADEFGDFARTRAAPAIATRPFVRAPRERASRRRTARGG
eukprot:gene12268-10474_t